jgi:hypothetical protein
MYHPRGAWRLAPLALVLLTAVPLLAEEPCFPPALYDGTLSGIEFGTTRVEARDKVAARIQERYRGLIMAEKGAVEKDALRKRVETEVAALNDNLVDFDGRPTGFDATVVGRDFAQKADETMFFLARGKDRAYLFFSQDKLWRVVYVLDGSEDYQGVRDGLEKLYGQPAKAAKGAPANAAVAWKGAGCTFTLRDERKLFNAYALTWEGTAEATTVAQHRKAKGASVETPTGSSGFEDSVLDAATGSPSENVDNVVDTILGSKPKPVEDVAGQARQREKDEDAQRKAEDKKAKQKPKTEPAPANPTRAHPF